VSGGTEAVATGALAPQQAPRGPEAPQATAKKRIDPRWLSSSLLTLILVIGQWRFQILGDSYVPWMLALGTALVAELVLHWLATGRTVNLLSAYISGNSVAILLKPAAGLLWPFVVCSLLAILSKYVLRYRERHLWNPTNLSVCLMLLLAPGITGMLSHEWGNDPLMVAVIWAVGLVVVTRARVWHLTIGYLVLFAVFAWVRTLLNGHPLLTELGPVTGPMYQLFMFFMVTDPRTIVSGRKQQLVVLLLVAAAECLIRIACDFEWIGDQNPLRFAPPMFALFLVGPVALWWQLRHAPAQPAPARAARA
jgi:enediyne biosynthesis protein E5